MKVSLVLLLCIFSCSYGKKVFGDEEQEWGYVNVREYAHMFYWLYYTTASANYYEKPLIIWLQGGPGQSSTGYGNFMELGPLDMHLKSRNHTWINMYNVLFIDSPVGAGFSYVEDPFHYSKTNAQIADDLFVFISKFYTLFPKFINTPVYIASESYGGKMTVEFANVWYKEQLNGKINSNLQGVVLGSPWISPIDSLMEYAPFLLSMQVINESSYKKVQEKSLLAKKAVEEGRWADASSLLSEVENTISKEAENDVNLFNAMAKPNSNSKYGDYMDNLNQLAFFMNTVVKQKLNLDIYWGHTAYVAQDALNEDFMKPVTEQVEILLNETDIRVYVFNGEFDIVVNSAGTLKWMNELRWKNAEHWKHAERKEMKIDGVIEGYVKQYDRLKMFWIKQAGHMAAADNLVAVNAILADMTNDS